METSFMGTGKEWARGLRLFYADLPEDTTPERIKANREKLASYLIDGQRLKASGVNHKAIDLFWELYHYFDTGYKSPYNIDDLPQLLKEQLVDMEIKAP